MTAENARDQMVREAQERVRRLKAEVAQLEGEVSRLAESGHAPVVLMAMVRCLVEMVCAQPSDVFRDTNKRQLYTTVLAMLRARGIS